MSNQRRGPKRSRAGLHFAGLAPPIQLAFSALSNAHYHYLVLEALIVDPALLQVREKGSEAEHTQANIRFQAHLRGFFWELTSALEMLLHHVNARFQLKVDLERSRSVKKSVDALRLAANLNAGATAATTLLSTSFESDWCYEVFRYRNSAHLAFLVVEGLYSPGGRTPPLMALQPAGLGEAQRFLPHALEDYRTKMLALANELAVLGLPSLDPDPSA